MSVSIKYKGTEIASASTEVTKTIKTAGKYCEADILVENTPDGGDAPVINPLSVTANGTYTAPSGVDGYSPVTVNVPQGITPSGKKLITDTSETDVAAFATAQVSSNTLLPENIKKDVNILGVVGSFEGGGGTTITDGIVVKARDANGYATEVDYYNSNGRINAAQFGGLDSTILPFIHISLFNFKNPITYIGTYGISYNTAITNLDLPDVNQVGAYAFRANTALKSISLPKLINIPAEMFDGGAIFRQCSALETIQIGSVGYGVTALNKQILYAVKSGVLLEIYTTGDRADITIANARFASATATIIVKASEDTTYGGTSYAAGETMITSEVA